MRLAGLRCLLFCSLTCLGIGSLRADGLEIHVRKDANGLAQTVEVVGLSPQQVRILSQWKDDDEAWPRVLSVHVIDETSKEQLPAMLGRHRLENHSLTFSPRFAWKPGVRYRIVLRPEYLDQKNGSTAVGGSASNSIVQDLVIPKRASGEPARVLAVYPSAKELPENLLRLYIQFSAPMSRGEAYRHLRLLDHSGQLIDAAFLEIGEELWDNSAQRLTLLMDPGRVKRGLKPREDMGPAISEGQDYVLEIDPAWKDAEGRPLAKGLRKLFRVIAPRETALDTKQWKIKSPQADSRDPLVVEFPHGLDHALLERTLTVARQPGESLSGKIEIENAERRWMFRPTSPWKIGSYELVVDTTLEDISGNRIGRPFEVDQFDTVARTTVAEFVRIPFEISAAQAKE